MKAVIIGAGIIGLSSAYYLQKSGWEVTVLDSSEGIPNCSYGNAGMIVPSHFLPLPSPGIVQQGLKWMLNSQSPFYIRASLDPALLRWGIKFLSFANEQHAQHSAPYLREIHLFSKQLYEELCMQPGFDFGMKQKGILVYYKTRKAEEEEGKTAEKARALGLDAAMIPLREIEHLEPGLHPNVLGAVHYRCDAHFSPGKLMNQLSEHLANNNVVIHGGCNVNSIGPDNKTVTAKTDKGDFKGDILVIAAGHRLDQLGKIIGMRLPLVSGKGYSITDTAPALSLNIPALLSEGKVAITPFDGSMRYGGTMEIGKANRKINLNRVKGIVNAVNDYFPAMQLTVPEQKDVWYGFRPCSPDGLPYLGHSKKLSNVIIAGGHSMMGMSLGPATGKIVAQLANGNTTTVDTGAFDPSRFD